MGNVFQRVTRAFEELIGQAPVDVSAQKASQGLIGGLRSKVDGYEREGQSKEAKASPYFVINYRQKITEWRNWITANSTSGDETAITAKSTQIETEWADLKRADSVAKKLLRFEPFLDAYVKKMQTATKLSVGLEKKFTTFIQQIKTFTDGMSDKSVSQLEAKRDEFNQTFIELRSEITEPGDPATLLLGVEDPTYGTFVQNANKEAEAAAVNPTTNQLMYDVKITMIKVFSIAFLVFIAIFLAVLASNDAIARPPIYRVFYFAFVFFVCMPWSLFFPFPPVYLTSIIIIGGYFFFKRFLWDSFKRDPTALVGIGRDMEKGIRFYAFLPLIPVETQTMNILWQYNIKSNPDRSGLGIAERKTKEYYTECARIVGQSLELTPTQAFAKLMSQLSLLASGASGVSGNEIAELQKKLTQLASTVDVKGGNRFVALQTMLKKLAEQSQPS